MPLMAQNANKSNAKKRQMLSIEEQTELCNNVVQNCGNQITTVKTLTDVSTNK